MICEYLRHWVFRFGVFYSIAMFFLQRDFHLLVIHNLGVHLVSGEKLLENRYPDQPVPSFWYSMESLRCCPVMQSLFPGFIGVIKYLCPCVL